MYRVFLVDDHEIVRRGLTELIDAEPDMHVVGEAADCSHALARIPALRPDIAVLDVRLPDGNGIELCRELRSRDPSLPCFILTSFTDDEAMLDAILAGAAGYVVKDIRGLELIGALRQAAAHTTLLDERATAAVVARLERRQEQRGPLAGLTPQERRLLGLLGEGLTNRQIAERMYLAEKTVKNYVSRLLAKLGVQRRTQAALLAARLEGESAR